MSLFSQHFHLSVVDYQWNRLPREAESVHLWGFVRLGKEKPPLPTGAFPKRQHRLVSLRTALSPKRGSF